ncbi:MAG TPA: DUF4855 domain-containing protein, partial [Bacillota bacterium]|nr:DUF4855 domain-containing protein [Bacillota bacterium]
TEGTTLLTDGKFATSTSYADTAFHAFYRCATREIVYELDELSAITGFCASFLCDFAAGVYIPQYVNLYVSENGTDYMLAYTVDGSLENQNTTVRNVDYKVVDGLRCRAKYIKFEFDVLVNIRCDELEVYGGEIDSTEAAFVKDPDTEWANEYDSGIEGLKDLLLIHAGSSKGINDNGEYVDYGDSYVNTTEEMFLPYVAYVKKDGTIVDTMFDSVLFLSLQGLCPSGGSLCAIDRPTIMSDWTYFAENIFSETSNMRALNNTVKTVKDALGLDDYTLSVCVAIPYPAKRNGDFGDIDGDGESEGCGTLEERTAVCNWFMDYVLDKFNNGGYDNLKFSGFYWTHESMTTFGSTDEQEIVKNAAALAHEKNTNFI